MKRYTPSPAWAPNLLAFPFFLLGSLAVTWPLALHLTTAIPLGSEGSPTVPWFNLWTLRWNLDRLAHGYQNYWQAPIFFPSRSAFAFSDPQPLTGLLAAPAGLVNPALGYNLILAGFLALNGWTVYWLLRRRGSLWGAAVCAGLAALLLPFVTHERGVLQLQPVFGMLWALAGLWDLANRPRLPSALLFVAGMGATFLTSQQYGLFLVLVLLPLGLVALRRAFLSRDWLPVLTAVAISAAFVLPVAAPQTRRVQAMGFVRSEATVQRNSASLTDYLQMPDEVLGGQLFPTLAGSRQRLFPGIGLLALGIAGTLAGLRSPKDRRWTLTLLVAAGLAFLISLGLNLHLGAWRPYTLLQRIVPGMVTLRSPFRLAIWVQLGVLLLGAQALAELWRRLPTWLAVLISVLVLVELVPASSPLIPIPELQEAGWMQEAVSPVIILPFVSDTSTSAYTQTVAWMLQTLPHDLHIVNGYSGFFPPSNGRFRELLKDFPSTGGLCALRDLGVATIVLHFDRVSGRQFSRLDRFMASGELQLIWEDQFVGLYRLADPDCPAGQRPMSRLGTAGGAR